MDSDLFKHLWSNWSFTCVLFFSLGHLQLKVADSIQLVYYHFVHTLVLLNACNSLALDFNVFDDNSLHFLISSLPCTDISFLLSDIHWNHIFLARCGFTCQLVFRIIPLWKLCTWEQCSFEDTGVEQLADGLEENKSLHKLGLCFSSIDVHGATTLASVLTNTSLKELDLRGNPAIGTEGAIKLINTLEQNESFRDPNSPSLLWTYWVLICFDEEYLWKQSCVIHWWQAEIFCRCPRCCYFLYG